VQLLDFLLHRSRNRFRHQRLVELLGLKRNYYIE
jgi:hypothetical protein